MTTVEITYNPEYPEAETVRGEFDNAADAARWVVANLAGWCVDEDVRVVIDGELFWGN